MDTIIAKVKVAPGELGYYDDVSGVFLTQENPIAEIKAGTNCTMLRRSVKCGRLVLLEGSLGRPHGFSSVFHYKKTKQTMIVEPAAEIRPTSTLTVERKAEPKKKVEASPANASADAKKSGKK